MFPALPSRKLNHLRDWHLCILRSKAGTQSTILLERNTYKVNEHTG
jgi:hypothetical protein